MGRDSVGVASYPGFAEFRYDESRLDLAQAASLRFDDTYRLAHLPLVSPGHPLAIDHRSGLDYHQGTYERARYSLVAPISTDELTASGPYTRFAEEMAGASFNDKISATMLKRRIDRLHATITGGLQPAEAPRQAEAISSSFRGRHGFGVRIMGPFLGTRNTGRIYLPVVPEIVRGEHAFGLIQRLLGLPVTGFYAVGVFNLDDELDQNQVRELHDVVERWKHETLAELRVTHLQILATHDDLALSARVLVDVPL